MSTHSLPPSKAHLLREAVQTELLGTHLAKKAARTRRHLAEGTQTHRDIERACMRGSKHRNGELAPMPAPEAKNSKGRSFYGRPD